MDAPEGNTSASDPDPESASAEQPSVEPRSHCEDGTCFACGSGICPHGYYCDESSDPACGWVPSCAAKPGCACLTRALGAGCTCEAHDDGLFVRCP